MVASIIFEFRLSRIIATLFLSVLFMASILSFGSCVDFLPSGIFYYCLGYLPDYLSTIFLVLLYPLTFVPFASFLLSNFLNIPVLFLYSYLIISLVVCIHRKVKGQRQPSSPNGVAAYRRIIALIMVFIIYALIASFISIQPMLHTCCNKKIHVFETTCNDGSTGVIQVRLKNLDTQLVVTTSDLQFRLDGTPLVPIDAINIMPQTIRYVSMFCDICMSGSEHSIRIIGPANSVVKSVKCK